MESDFGNVYEDSKRASAYAGLGFPGAYAIAYRDLPALFAGHVRGRRALDFGCGTGRSSRFLRKHGFGVVGVDISAAMLEHARAPDSEGDYRLVEPNDPEQVVSGPFDLVLSAFTFDNIPTLEQRERTLGSLRRLLADAGCLITIVSSPDIYVNEWASFSTKDYPENRHARSGDHVRIVMLDVADQRPVEDVVCFDEDYRRMFARAGLSVREVLRPLATGEEPVRWKAETEVAPWTTFVLAREETPDRGAPAE